MMKQGVIIGFLGKTQDRFSEYQQQADTRAKLEIVKQIEGFDGVEMVFPYETGVPAETKKLMDEIGLIAISTPMTMIPGRTGIWWGQAGIQRLH